MQEEPLQVVWNYYIDDYDQYIAYCQQGNRKAMIGIDADDLGDINLSDDDAIIAKMQEIVQDKDLSQMPRLEDAAPVTQYLVHAVANSANNMFYMDKDGLEEIQKDFGKPWDELVPIIEADIERFQLADVLEVCRQDETDFDYVATCFGNLQFAFSEENISREKAGENMPDEKKILTEEMFVNNKNVGTELTPIGFQEDEWFLLDDCYRAEIDGRDSYAAHAVKMGDLVIDGKAPMYQVEIPIVDPEGETVLDKIGGEMADVGASEVQGSVRVDEKKLDLLKYIERDLNETMSRPVEVLSARKMYPDSESYRILAGWQKGEDKEFISWNCGNHLGAGFDVTSGHYYDTASDAMLDHICRGGCDLETNEAKLKEYGVHKDLTGFKSVHNMKDVKKVTDYAMNAVKENSSQTPFYADHMHSLMSDLYEVKGIEVNQAQEKAVQDMSDVVFHLKLYDPENQKVCEKMVKTISKVVDQAYNRQQGR